MLEIILKIDGGNSVVFDGSAAEVCQDSKIPEPLIDQKPRKLQTFMFNGVQYFKAEKICWIIKKNETIEAISQSKYYDKRGLSDYEV